MTHIPFLYSLLTNNNVIEKKMKKSDDITPLLEQLTRIADALERQFPRNIAPDALEKADAYVWKSDIRRLVPIRRVNRLDISLLRGIDEQRDNLLSNTLGFVEGLPANNALLWGARGTGKSSLVQGLLGQFGDQGLRMVEVSKDHLADMSEILAELARLPYRFIVFCDDLSFEAVDATRNGFEKIAGRSISKKAAF